MAPFNIVGAVVVWTGRASAAMQGNLWPTIVVVTAQTIRLTFSDQLANALIICSLPILGT